MDPWSLSMVTVMVTKGKLYLERHESSETQSQEADLPCCWPSGELAGHCMRQDDG